MHSIILFVSQRHALVLHSVCHQQFTIIPEGQLLNWLQKKPWDLPREGVATHGADTTLLDLARGATQLDIVGAGHGGLFSIPKNGDISRLSPGSKSDPLIYVLS